METRSRHRCPRCRRAFAYKVYSSEKIKSSVTLSPDELLITDVTVGVVTLLSNDRLTCSEEAITCDVDNAVMVDDCSS